MTHEDEHGRGQGDEALQPSTKPLMVGEDRATKDKNSSDKLQHALSLHLVTIVSLSAEKGDARQKTA